MDVNILYDITNRPWMGGHYTTYGLQITFLLIVAMLSLAFYNSERSKLAHIAKWLTWLAIFEALIAAIETSLDKPFLIGRPAYIVWFIVGFKELAIIVFVIAYCLSYKKHFKKQSYPKVS